MLFSAEQFGAVFAAGRLPADLTGVGKACRRVLNFQPKPLESRDFVSCITAAGSLKSTGRWPSAFDPRGQQRHHERREAQLGCSHGGETGILPSQLSQLISLQQVAVIISESLCGPGSGGQKV